MNKTEIARPRVVSRDNWLRERKILLEKEKELTRERDRVAALRRKLPMVSVDKKYTFDSENGELDFLQLFDGCTQLIVYHFMFDPTWEAGCENCAIWAAEKPKALQNNLQNNDTKLVLVARAPIAKIAQYRQSKGWEIPFYSSYNSDFNFDFQVSFDESKRPIDYNYRSLEEHRAAGTSHYFEGRKQPYELHGLSIFLQHNQEIFHTYSTFSRGCEEAGGFHYLLDMTAYGRRQSWEDSPPGWPQQPLPYES